ncbi:amidase [Micromonospora sp. CPCC 206061]|uniref:amidase n=1 Tax=Micromonospora sp. CPCC 206061 TaxID=3122410 RepID=UPI002FF1F010
MRRSAIEDIRGLLRDGGSSVVDLIQRTLADIAEQDATLGAFVSVAGEGALREAEAADGQIRRRGDAVWAEHPLLGVPVSVKDLIQTRDLPTARGSILENRRPPVDAPAVARLRAAGAIVIGKTATSEYGWSATTISRVGPPTRNPWDPERSAGGSSGGAAAAVTAGLCAASLGTDGAGSIRIPAAFCGVVGFKPSFGRVPYVPPCADRLAHVGPLAASVGDVAELTAILAGPHRDDPDSGVTSAEQVVRSAPLRIGWLEFPGTSAEVRATCVQAHTALAAAGHQIEPVEVPFADPYAALVDLLAAAEAAGTPPESEPWCDPARLAVVRHGRTVSGETVMRAEQVRLTLRARLRRLMDRYDVLAMATIPIEPFHVDAIGPEWAEDPSDLLWLAWSPATYPFNMTGQPAISIPVGRTPAGLPVGLQLVGSVGEDHLVLATARQVEEQLDPLPAPPRGAMKG